MDLILWRHADAEDGYPDAQRKLSGKGHKQAAKMAAWLGTRVSKHVTVLVSPAVRTQQTAQAFCSKFSTSEDVGLSANPDSILRAAGWLQSAHTVIVVGHQPTLGMTAAKLLTGREAEWSVRRGAIVWIAHKNGRNVLRAVLPPELV